MDTTERDWKSEFEALAKEHKTLEKLYDSLVNELLASSVKAQQETLLRNINLGLKYRRIRPEQVEKIG